MTMMMVVVVVLIVIEWSRYRARTNYRRRTNGDVGWVGATTLMSFIGYECPVRPLCRSEMTFGFLFVCAGDEGGCFGLLFDFFQPYSLEHGILR